MTTHRFPWHGWIAGVWFVAAMAAGDVRSAVGDDASILQQEPLLHKRISVTALEEPVDTLLARLAMETGAPLAASKDTGYERLTLFVKDRPAHEVLTVAAEHLDYNWVREIRGKTVHFVLAQSTAAQKREQALREHRSGIGYLRKRLEDQAASAAGAEALALAGLTPAERRRRYEQNDVRLHGKVVVQWDADGKSWTRIPSGPAPGRQEAEALEREQRALMILSPELEEDFTPLNAAAHVYRSLGPETREKLWRGQSIDFAFPPERGRIGVGPQAAHGIATGGLRGLMQFEDPTTGEETAATCKVVDRVRGRMYLVGRGLETRLRMRVRALGSVGRDGSFEQVEAVFKDETFPQPGPRYEADKCADSATLALRDPVLLTDRESDSRIGGPRLVKLLAQIAAQVPYPIVADGYTVNNSSRDKPGQIEPLGEVLRELSRRYLRTCRFNGGYLRLRHYDWATARAIEPPANRVERWESAVRTKGALSLSDIIEIGGGLTREQSEVLVARWHAMRPHGLARLVHNDLEGSGPLLRLLWALPEAQRRRLFSERPVPVGGLPPASIPELRALVEAATDSVWGFEEADGPDNKPFVPGSGFAAEDRLENALAHGILRLRRTPYSWLFAGRGHFPANALDSALSSERQYRQDATEKDLRRIEGSKVSLRLEIPRAEPVEHHFLVAADEPAVTERGGWNTWKNSDSRRQVEHSVLAAR